MYSPCSRWGRNLHQSLLVTAAGGSRTPSARGPARSATSSSTSAQPTAIYVSDGLTILLKKTVSLESNFHTE